ncbi:hypothetical protein DSM43518_02027 [Mycobacterium marinum]|uniref:hypothetical protein n=1 Tax=Mycobacterium marinum TaxID=1781 RepID=UPI000E3BB43E|nr:hypothetical protein [Mycobacterium marinum]RFZ11187.1 hypothetical protein DSM43518_02027 [Mycobacterium marinum]
MDIATFTAEYGALSTAQTATATRLLNVASARIDELKTDVDADAAAQVVFEVVRDALNFGALERLSAFQNTTGRKTESGTFDEAMKVVNDYLTDRHKRLLGIPLRAAPRGSFTKCDY